MILDPMFPVRGPFPIENTNIIFGRRFGIPCKMDTKRWFIRKVRPDEILRMYYIPADTNLGITRFLSAMLDDSYCSVYLGGFVLICWKTTKGILKSSITLR